MHSVSDTTERRSSLIPGAVISLVLVASLGAVALGVVHPPQTERTDLIEQPVPEQRVVQNVVPLRAFGPRHHVAHHIVAGVTHVDVARRIGEHLQHIVFWPTGVLRDEGGSLGPSGLLAGFGGLGFVTGHGRPESRKGADALPAQLARRTTAPKK